MSFKLRTLLWRINDDDDDDETIQSVATARAVNIRPTCNHGFVDAFIASLSTCILVYVYRIMSCVPLPYVVSCSVIFSQLLERSTL